MSEVSKESNESEVNKILEDLQQQYPIMEQVSFDEFSILEKQSRQPFLLMEYQGLLDREKYILDELREMLDALVGKQYDYYKFQYDKELLKPEIEKYYLPNDKKIRKLKNIIRKQEVRVGFFEACVKGMSQLGWAIKNYIDAHKNLT